jgi:3-hydroxyisobutyrate dehydrogenase
VVTDDAAMRQIFAETGDTLLTHAGGRLFVNCATVSPAVHVEVERLVERAGGQSLEGCMASSIPQAREGTLYLMVGGKREAYERALPILRAMSKDLRFIGEAGRAAQVKALVNMVMNINTAGLAEGLGLGAALGLDLDMLREVFSQTGANSRVLETDGPDMQRRDRVLLLCGARGEGFRHRARARPPGGPLAAAGGGKQGAVRSPGGDRLGRVGQVRHRRVDLSRPRAVVLSTAG